MDTHLKERLVGAAVLVAAAVILIPEMLSGPDEATPETAASQPATADSGVRTYTIDLANPRQAQDERPDEPVATVVEGPAPPPESDAPANDTSTSVTMAEAPPASEPEPVASAAPPPQREAAPLPAAPARNLPWAVQAGSFASQATAAKLKADLEQRGYTSFVVPFKTATQTLYRVRIGPMQDRAAADATLQKLKREGMGATVVSNP